MLLNLKNRMNLLLVLLASNCAVSFADTVVGSVSATSLAGSDSAHLSASVPSFMQVEITSPDWNGVIDPVNFSAIQIPVMGFVRTNLAGPNHSSNGVIVKITSTTTSPALRRNVLDPYSIKVNFSGSIGGSPNNDINAQPLYPQFTNGVAAINLLGQIGSNSAMLGASSIPWQQLPSGIYTENLTITATSQ